jgi:hypothetical protein
LALDLQHICAELELETWRAPSDGLRGLVLDMQSLCAEYGLQIWLAQTEEIQRICAEYRIETWLSPSDEFLVLFDVMWKITRYNWWYSCIGFTQTYCVEFGLETWLMTNKTIHALSINIQAICAEYELETWLAARDEIRVLAFEIQSIHTDYGMKTWLLPSDKIRVLSHELLPKCIKNKPKFHTRQVMKFKHWCSIYSLSVLNIGPKNDLHLHSKLSIHQVTSCYNPEYTLFLKIKKIIHIIR